MKRYEFIEHTADIAIRAYGDSLEEAFACAAEAFFEIVTNKGKIEPTTAVTVEAEGIDRESLLVGFLSKLMLTLEVEGMVAGSFEVELIEPFRVRAIGGGEKFDQTRHSGGLQIKGVSYHMLEIHEGRPGEPSWVQVLFDI